MGSLLAYAKSWCTITTLIVYIIICFIPAIFMAKQAKKFKGNDELNKKYWAFHRWDVDNWKVPRLAFDAIIYLFPIRFSIAWSIVVIVTTWMLIVMTGQDWEKPVAKWREKTLRYTIKPFARMHMLMCGVGWIKYKRRSDVNWEYYLGPNWKPSFEGAGI